MKNQHPMHTLWAVLSVDKDGNEGICGMIVPIPGQLVTGSPKVRDLYREAAREMMGGLLPKDGALVLASFVRTRSDDEVL